MVSSDFIIDLSIVKRRHFPTDDLEWDLLGDFQSSNIIMIFSSDNNRAYMDRPGRRLCNRPALR